MSDIKAETKNDNNIDDVSKVSLLNSSKILRQAEFSCCNTACGYSLKYGITLLYLYYSYK